MKELYLDYIKERLNKESIIWEGKAFLIYTVNEQLKEAYLQDVYVAPEYRKQGILAKFQDEFEDMMKERGCTHILGSVQPSANGSTHGLAYCLKRGYKLLETGDDYIWLRKELE